MSTSMARDARPVLLVRARGGEDRDAAALTACGIDTVEDPYLVTRTCDDPDAGARAARVLELMRVEADVLLLTSRTALRALEDLAGDAQVRRAAAAGAARGLAGAAVGPSTAAALRELGLRAVVEPETATSRGLLDTLRRADDVRPRTAVLPCGAQAMKGLAEGLRTDGWQVEQVVLYSTEQVAHQPRTVARLASGDFAAVVVRSPTAVRAVAARVPALPATTTLVCGGPTTAAAARELPAGRVVVCDGPTPDEVADTVRRVLAGGPGTLMESDPERA